jgi:hypothetical protein
MCLYQLQQQIQGKLAGKESGDGNLLMHTERVR